MSITTNLPADLEEHSHGEEVVRGGRRIGKDDLGLLLGLPVVCLVIIIGWVIWRQTATLDDIESNALAVGEIWQMTIQHIKLTIIASLMVVITAIPAGIVLTRPGMSRFAGPVSALANMGQAAPVIGILVLLAMWIGFDVRTALITFWVYAFLPVLRNTIVGLEGVDPTLKEAARGMGMSNMMTLLRVELPIALPVIMVGVRTALVLVVGTAAFAYLINAGGLGSLIGTGITLFRNSVLISGALIISVLALLVDWFGRVLELLFTPKGL